MWFAMFLLAIVSVIYSIIYLSNEKRINDTRAFSFAHAATFFGVLGLVTGMIWVNYSWNTNPNKIVLWVKEGAKLQGAAAGTLIYAAYLVLRMFVNDPVKRGRFSAIYNIFGFVMLMMFSFVIPRLNESTLHPGNGGNPGFNIYDVSSNMRLVFYPAIIAFTLLGVWLATLRVRITQLKSKIK